MLRMSGLPYTKTTMIGNAVSRMRNKYEMMLSLRLQRERLEAQGIMRLEGDEARARRRASQALASAFPGALKQLDTMDSGMMEQRLAALDGWLESPGSEEVAQWCRLEACYHALLADFLAAKRWLAEHGGGGLSDPEIWEAWLAEGLFPEIHWQSCGFGDSCVQSIRRPPGGRLSELVWAALSRVFREPVDVLKANFATWAEER